MQSVLRFVASNRPGVSVRIYTAPCNTFGIYSPQIDRQTDMFIGSLIQYE